MSDTFLEFMVKKRTTSKDALLKVGVIAAGLVVAIALMMLSPLLGMFSMFGFLAAAGAIYGAYRLFSMLNLEYEYVITNGDLDVDKIINQNARKRMVSVKCSSFDTFGRYDEAQHRGKSYKTRIFACTAPTDENVWCATFNHGVYGQTLLVFNADDKMLDAFKKYLPKMLSYEVFVKKQMQ